MRFLCVVRESKGRRWLDPLNSQPSPMCPVVFKCALHCPIRGTHRVNGLLLRLVPFISTSCNRSSREMTALQLPVPTTIAFEQLKVMPRHSHDRKLHCPNRRQAYHSATLRGNGIH